MSKLIFDDETIQAIFGHEAAEDENPSRLREYYFKSKVFDRVSSDLALRILVGHKGIGKSALFSVAQQEDFDKKIPAVLIRPDDVQEIQASGSNMLESIRQWKEGLSRIIFQKAAEYFEIPDQGKKPLTLKKPIQLVEGLAKLFKPAMSKVIDYDQGKKSILEYFMTNKKIRVYLDDLDRGWTANQSSILRLSSMLNALRDMAKEHLGLQFRIALRSDVYYLVRTSDESTDKIEGSVVWHTWTNHEILALLVKRIESYFGISHSESELIAMPQSTLASFLERVMRPRFLGKGKWENIPVHKMLMSLIRRRPRDLVKLCTLAAQQARQNNNELIDTEDFNTIFDEYSQGRLQDTINEFRSELPNLQALLLNMKPNRARRASKKGAQSSGYKKLYMYTNAELTEKLTSVLSNHVLEFYGGRAASPKELTGFLYKINFLTATRDSGNFIIRRYFEEHKYISSGVADFGFDWEVHPAYRWALQPEDPKDIFDEMKPSED